MLSRRRWQRGGDGRCHNELWQKCGLHQVHHILAPRHYCLFRGKRRNSEPRVRRPNLTTGKRQFYPTRYSYIEPTSEEDQQPSFIVTVSAFSNVNYYYGSDYWYNYWGWYPGWNWIWGPTWGPGWGPSYPWYPVTVYSYRSGSIVIDMISNQPRSQLNQESSCTLERYCRRFATRIKINLLLTEWKQRLTSVSSSHHTWKNSRIDH